MFAMIVGFVSCCAQAATVLCNGHHNQLLVHEFYCSVLHAGLGKVSFGCSVVNSLCHLCLFIHCTFVFAEGQRSTVLSVFQ